MTHADYTALAALVDDVDEPTRQQIEMARIAQGHREWSGPCGHVEGWQPVEIAGKAIDVDGVLQRAERPVVAETRLPWLKRLLRWWEGAK